MLSRTSLVSPVVLPTFRSTAIPSEGVGVSTSSAVRVLPSSRPEARTWLAATARRELLERGPAAPRRPAGSGRVDRVGRAWAARVDEDLPDAARWSAWFAVAVGEAVLGRRPATQLAGWTSPEVLAGLARRQRLRRADVVAPRTVMLSGRVQHPAPRVAEASAVLRAGTRLLVLALRFEGGADRWVCTALDAGLTPERRRTPGATSGASAAG